MPEKFTKDPESTLDYMVDWNAENWLGDDTISSVSWEVAPGLTIENESNTTTTATVWLSGGTLGESYRVTNRIVTAGGREDDRTFSIRVREK